jgi:hypothetical protein
MGGADQLGVAVITVEAVTRDNRRSLASAMSSRDQTYKSLARNGVTMITAATVTYASEQIDLARAAMDTASNETAYESSKLRLGDGSDMTDIADQR